MLIILLDLLAIASHLFNEVVVLHEDTVGVDACLDLLDLGDHLLLFTVGIVVQVTFRSDPGTGVCCLSKEVLVFVHAISV